MSRQAAEPHPSNPGGPPGSVTNNKQPGAAVCNTSNKNFVSTTTSWVSRYDAIEGISTGLGYLTTIDTLAAKITLEVPDLDSSVLMSRNRYSIRNADGEQVYLAAEKSKYWQRMFCGPQRGFTFNVMDNTKRKVMVLHRPFKWCSLSAVPCFAGISCFAQECTVECPPGNVIGTISQRPSCCCMEELLVRDETGKDICTIQGKCESSFTPCSDQDYSILSMDGKEVGSITKKYGGCCGDAGEGFRVSFQMDLDAKMKTLLLGASFLIDLTSYEATGSN